MANPPVLAGDGPAILDDAILWRRINPEWWVLDVATGQYRLSSAAFQNLRDENKKDTNAMSVGVAAEIQGGTATFLQGHDGYGIAAFTAGHTRHECKQIVSRAPEAGQPWHAHVIGKKTGSVQKCLRSGSKVVVEPKH